MEWLGGGSWIKAHEREFENNAATPIRPAQESPSNALVLESDEDDTVNDDATEIKSSRESHKATETETQNHEPVDPVDRVELTLPQESDDMMDDVATPIIDPQEIPQGETMSKSNDKIALPKRISETGTKGVVLKRINKRSNLKLVDVKCILGDPELHSDLVEDVDCEFGRVVDLVKRGYRLKRQDWLNGSVDIAVAEAEVNGQNADYELDETKVLKNYIDAKRQEIAKGKKNGVRPPREVDHQEEDDTEVEHGAKESDTSKVNEEQPHEEEEQEVDVDDGDKESENSETNEGHTQEEEEQQQEDDTEVNADVDVGAKESENPKTNEDGEVNEDASKKHVKGTKKRGRVPKGMKKGVTPPRQVQQQVKDDAEVDAKESKNPKTNEDGEVNEDASKKHMKFTKKRGRVTKEHNVDTSKPKRQKKQEDSAADAIGRVLEDLKKAD
ncbi:hypothetical protein F2Q68_00033623 [Brassica cretica]|uniref:Uncharacterized protein n=1 Tax=Brassica cretica TaxID=69181 RepID=A0A8S9H3S7_BRACR|nr:hypothetical protein F2Q68_00033623 [Brassica cretica]